VQHIERLFKQVKIIYDQNQSPFDGVCHVAKLCIEKISRSLKRVQSIANGKEYWVLQNDQNITRPYLPTLLIESSDEFERLWGVVVRSINPSTHVIELDEDTINNVIYTSVMSFALTYDLWKPKSRKTPGTYFEVVLGSIMSRMLPLHTRLKHIILPGQAENVSTDIVFQPNGEGPSLVIPAKITTRERIVQPFAHQRILDSVFGVGQYKSILMCVSETQRDEDTGVNDICVPGTIRLFQTHLARMYGIYYLDPPNRYLQDDITSIITVGSVASFLSRDVVNFI